MKKSLLLLSLSAQIIAGASVANADKERGGGDPISLTRREVYQTVEYLQTQVKLYLPLINSESLSPQSRKVFDDIKAKGLAEDISMTPPYEAKEECQDENGQLVSTAISTTKTRNQRICFNVPKLFEQKATFSQLIGMAFHEHAHHFGYDDIGGEYSNPLNILASEISQQVLQLQSVANRGSMQILDFRFVSFARTNYGYQICLPNQKVKVTVDDWLTAVAYAGTSVISRGAPQQVTVDMVSTSPGHDDVLSGAMLSVGRKPVTTLIQDLMDRPLIRAESQVNNDGNTSAVWFIVVMNDCSKLIKN